MNLVMTVKGYFAIADDYEREAAELKHRGEGGEWHFSVEYKVLMEAARRSRNSAYKLLGVPTVDDEQRHMGEVMADF